MPIPLLDRFKAITRELQRAEKQFRDGHFNPCVASCRLVLDELGHLKFGPGDWAGPLGDRIAKNRGNMTGGEREAAAWAAVRHYAHHGPSAGGRAELFAADAKVPPGAVMLNTRLQGSRIWLGLIGGNARNPPLAELH